MKFELWTDGSCRGNGRDNAVGGWAYLINDVTNDGIIIQKDAGAADNTTNNQMELTAIINGLKRIDEITNAPNDIIASSHFEPSFWIEITVMTDSAYIQRCWAEQWYRKWQANGWQTSNNMPVKNRDLWQQLIPYFDDPRISFEKVRGHMGVELNEMVDKMATTAADHFKRGQIDESSSNKWISTKWKIDLC